MVKIPPQSITEAVNAAIDGTIGYRRPTLFGKEL